MSSFAGPDKITSKLIKNTKIISASFLILLFSQSFTTGNLPIKWKAGKIVPVYKSGNRNPALNYCPISVTSVPYEIIEHAIFSQLIDFLDSNYSFSFITAQFPQGILL